MQHHSREATVNLLNMQRLLPHFVKYAVTVAKQLLPHLINMQSRSREATVAQSQSRSDRYPILLNMQSHSRETVAQSQSRSDCYPILLNMQSHSREATVTPRRIQGRCEEDLQALPSKQHFGSELS